MPELPSSPRIELKNLFYVAKHPEKIEWESFKQGVAIHRIYGDPETGPAAVLLWYREAASVPLHEHTGYEHVLVLSGSQRDQSGIAEAGTLVVNAPGTQHDLVSDAGCIVLVIYEKPVRFITAEPPV